MVGGLGPEPLCPLKSGPGVWSVLKLSKVSKYDTIRYEMLF